MQSFESKGIYNGKDVDEIEFRLFSAIARFFIRNLAQGLILKVSFWASFYQILVLKVS